MGVVDEALTRLLTSGRADRMPERLEDVLATFGPSARVQNPAVAMELAGTRDKRSAAYKAAIRRVQRWRTTGAERRRPTPATLALLRRVARRNLVGARVADVRRSGLLMRIRAVIRVSRQWRTHTMPGDAGGRPRYQHIAGGQVATTLDAWLAGDLDEVHRLLLEAFFTAYWGVAEPADVDEISMCQLRMGGSG